MSPADISSLQAYALKMETPTKDLIPTCYNTNTAALRVDSIQRWPHHLRKKGTNCHTRMQSNRKPNILLRPLVSSRWYVSKTKHYDTDTQLDPRWTKEDYRLDKKNLCLARHGKWHRPIFAPLPYWYKVESLKRGAARVSEATRDTVSSLVRYLY